MTPETDPGQRVPSGATPIGNGTWLARFPSRQDPQHPAVRHAAARMATAPRPVPPQRTLHDHDIEQVARAIGMVDRGPKHREGPRLRKRDAARAALRRMLPGGQA